MRASERSRACTDYCSRSRADSVGPGRRRRPPGRPSARPHRKKRSSAYACGLGFAASLLGSSAVSSDAPSPETLQFAATPFVGYQVGGNFQLADTGQSVRVDDHASAALALDLRTADLTQYELFYGRQSSTLSGDGFVPTSVKVEYLHLGGLVELDETEHLKPYFGGGLGITRLSPDSAQGSDDTRFSISLALGLRVPLNPHFSLRFEGRGFLTPVNTDSTFFCSSQQTGALCELRAQGSVFFQFDFLAGVTYTF
jgi:opacity protein-like surface antigen